jgi:hypothetical protein
MSGIIRTDDRFACPACGHQVVLSEPCYVCDGAGYFSGVNGEKTGVQCGACEGT